MECSLELRELALNTIQIFLIFNLSRIIIRSERVYNIIKFLIVFDQGRNGVSVALTTHELESRAVLGIRHVGPCSTHFLNYLVCRFIISLAIENIDLLMR